MTKVKFPTYKLWKESVIESEYKETFEQDKRDYPKEMKSFNSYDSWLKWTYTTEKESFEEYQIRHE
jgi:hypothetical protein